MALTWPEHESIRAPFAEAVQGDMARRMRAAVDVAGRPDTPAQQSSPTTVADRHMPHGGLQDRLREGPATG
mgnify:CR=1 FL=1